MMERNSSSSFILSFLKTHFKGKEFPFHWLNNCCLIHFPCHHIKEAGLDHAKIHMSLGSNDASTQTEPLQDVAEDVISDNDDNMIGSLLDNQNIELSNIDIKQEPDTRFEVEKAIEKHGSLEDEINLPNWQILGIPGDTNHMILTPQPRVVFHETFNKNQVTESLLGFRQTKAMDDDGTCGNTSNLYSRKEKSNESTVASTIRDNVSEKDSVSREEMGKVSTGASTNKPIQKVDTGNEIAGKEKDPDHSIVTATARNEKPSNAKGWLRSGGKKPEVSNASLASMWKQAKQEMNEENDKAVKGGRSTSKKQKKSGVPLRAKCKIVRDKPISETKPSKKCKKGKVHNKEVDRGAIDSEDNEDKEGMNGDDSKNDDEKEDKRTPKKTRINYVGDVRIDLFDLSQYYTFVKELSSKGEDGYRCDLCNLTFIGPEEDKKRIERHIVIHSEGERTHKCVTCGKTFSSRHYLDKHALSHSDIRSFQCPVCDFASKRKDHVRGHIRKRHSIGPDQYADKDGKPVTLEELGYGYLHRPVKPNEQGLFDCLECDAVLDSRKDLNTHLETVHKKESDQGMQAVSTSVTVHCL